MIIDAIRSGVPAVNLVSSEHLRVDELITSVANELEFKVREWNPAYGWVDFKNKQPQNKDKTQVSLFNDLNQLDDLDYKENKTCIVIKSADFILDDKNKQTLAKIQHQILRIQQHFKMQAFFVLCSGKQLNLPNFEGLYISHVYELLSAEKLNKHIERFIESEKIQINAKTKNKLISTLCGMHKETINQVLHRNLNKFKQCWEREASLVAIKAKEQFVAQSGIVDLINPEQAMLNSIGGLENLKDWLRRKKQIFDRFSDAARLGIVPPKGILLVGMPGCGKSLTAKATASFLQLPLLRLDIGSLMGKYVGESETNMKKALTIAEQVSPCVLWIDELEKAFSGLHSSGGGGEVTTRLFGYFLTWMQEKSVTVFVIATANDITQLPPELLRKGRFDEIFYIDLPNGTEREKIFEVHLKRSKNNLSKPIIRKLAQETKGFSGADIQAVLNNALEDMFISERSRLASEDLIKSIKKTIPISESLKSKVDGYKKLFKQFKLTPASLPEDESKRISGRVNSDNPADREEAVRH